MTERLRQAIEVTIYAIEERDALTRDMTCAHRHPIAKLIPPELRSAIDELYAALADEPGPSRGELLEVD